MDREPMRAPTDESRHSPTRRARPWLAALLSVLQPGLGHLYLWRPALALAALAAWAAAAAIAVWLFLHAPGVLALVLGSLLGLAATVVIAWHALRLARADSLASRPSRLVLAAALVAFYVGMSLLSGEALDWTRAHVVQAFRIPSGAMEPTILPGDYLFVAQRRGGPLRRDRPATLRRDGGSFLYRVVGLPGDTLSMRDGRLVRNGRTVSEPYARTDAERSPPSSDFDWQRSALVAGRDSASYQASVDDWGPLLVPERSVFVLGDNRHNSLDSRYTGFIPSDSVLGAPVSVYFSRDPEAGEIRWSRIGRRLDRSVLTP